MDTVLTLGIEIADALDAAHSAGIIHRDIKPANIFISPRGHAKILDFGLAKMGSPIAHAADSPTLSSAATQGGMVLGTAAYMAPEQARGEMVDHRADLWALGLVLYEMATGTRPMAAVRLRVEQSPDLERIISKCLEADRELRYQHASDIRTDLQRLRRDSGSAQATSLTATLPTRWKMVLAAASAAVLTLSVAGYVYLHRAAPTLTEKDTIVLADFENKTGDPVFDDTLRQGLSVRASTIAVPQPDFGPAGPANAGADGTAEGGAADFGSRSANLRANGKCRRAGRLDRQPWEPIRIGPARQELQYRKHSRSGADSGGEERRRPEFPE